MDALAITEHLFRFQEAYDLLSGWWDSDPDPLLRTITAAYWRDHVNLSLAEYVRLIEDAKSSGLPVYLGIEMDWIPGKADALRRLLQPYDWDVVLGSVHWIGAFGFDNPDFLFEWDKRRAEDVFSRYAALLEDLAGSGLADVLAHPDLPKLFGYHPSDSGPLHEAILSAAGRSGCALEINTNGLRQPAAEIYPAAAVLSRACAAGIPITFASDAHTPERVGQAFDEARRLAMESGYREVSAFVARRRTAFPL